MVPTIATLRKELLKEWFRHFNMNIIANYIDKENNDITLKSYAKLLLNYKIKNVSHILQTCEQFSTMGLI